MNEKHINIRYNIMVNKNNYKILKIKKKFCYENISKGTKFQDYCIDSIGKRLKKTLIC